jgi:hypothetical protein
MKKIILILIFMSTSLFAQKGDIEASINFGTMSGSGFGITYNVTDTARVKLDGFFVNIMDSYDDDQFYTLGASVNLDLVQLKDGISSIYFLSSFSTVLINNDNRYKSPVKVFAIGAGVRSFIGKKLFVEVELGYGYYMYNKNDFMSMLAGNFNLGYRF